MKIYVTENVDQIIDNYTMMPIVYGKINIDNIPFNCADEIIIDSMDNIPYSEKDLFFDQITSRLRLNGKLILFGMDLEIICQYLLNGSISIETINKILFDKSSIYTVENIKQDLNKRQLTIEYINIMETKYEIRCHRIN